jgi:hypothetical protein
LIVIDEYPAARVIFGNWPEELPDDDLALPASRHWRLLQRIHNPGTGQLSTVLARFSRESLDAIRFPRPEVLQVLDTRVLLDEAAQITAQYGGAWIIGETLAAGQMFGQALWFGRRDNIGSVTAGASEALGITIQVI